MDSFLPNAQNQVRRTKIHRLFYVDYDKSSNDESFKITTDSKGLSETSQALGLLNGQHVEFCGIYGDQDALKDQLFALFPGDRSVIETPFQDDNILPAIYHIHNDRRMIFALVNCDYRAAMHEEKLWTCTIVMQQFLQDICPNIIISPSESFFTNFTDKHSFHGRPHRPRIYHQREMTHQDITTAQRIHVEDQEALRTLLGEHYRKGLASNIGRHAFYHHKKREENVNTAKKFELLKHHLVETINLDTINSRIIINICRKCEIQVSKQQQIRISQQIESTLASYQMTISAVNDQAKSFFKELNSQQCLLGFKSSYIVELPKATKTALYTRIREWLINPTHDGQTAFDFTNEIVSIIISNGSLQQRSVAIPQDQAYQFLNKLTQNDRKTQVKRLVNDLIEAVCLALQSENAFEVHFYLYHLSYVPLDSGKTIFDLNVKHTKTLDLCFSSFADLLKITHLTENDRRVFANRMEFVACFKAHDVAGEILIVRVPKINNNQINNQYYAHKILSVKNCHLQLIAEYNLEKISIAFAFNASSQTIIIYNINNNNVNKCVLNSLGQKQSSNSLAVDSCAKFSNGIKSMALTVAQALLIIIDGESNVYSIDVTKSVTTSLDLQCKSTDGITYENKFVADNDELYECVQTIGERSPIFFFQSKSSVDIINQNFHQLQSIKLSEHASPYRMHIFTDLMTTYCVFFNDAQYEAYAVQNLILDSRIERQQSANDLSNSVKESYVGNRLLDVIKKSEIQFGPTVNIETTKYHLLCPSTMTNYTSRIYRYFHALSLHAELQINDNIPFQNFSLRDSEEACHRIYGRVPLQLSTIDRGFFIPLNEGRREVMEDLAPHFFSVEDKATEISFSYLDEILNSVDHNLLVIGVIGRQSNGKSYLMNRLFGTRFAVAAGRCTDGIWISYVVCDNQQYIILDCEGLFSEQRTEDEEIKLLAFLAAMCDVTILSQDLGFSRYQDRLFSHLAESAKKIKATEKLFQGYLLVAVRDISDNNADEATDAAEQKFTDLSQKGNSEFLRELFSKKFAIQPLHHYENVNFQHEIVLLREKFGELKDLKRWNNGKELCDRMKILLAQLYLDDFSDSGSIQTQVNFSKLKDAAKRLWLFGDLEDSKIQSLSKNFQDTKYTLELDHAKLQLDDESMENNYTQLCEFLRQSAAFHVTTPEENNRLLKFLDSLTTEILDYRRKEVRKLLRQEFNQLFPKETESLKEKSTVFFEEIDQYINSFELRMCSKTCPRCSLSCVRRSEHAETSKMLLEKTKEKLKDFESEMDNKPSANDAELLADQIHKAMEKENNISRKKNRLEAQRNYLHEKNQLDSQINSLRESVVQVTNTIDTIKNEMKMLTPIVNTIENIDQLIQTEIKSLSDSQSFQFGEQQILMKKFYDEYLELDSALIRFNTDDGQQNELNQLICSMNDGISRLHERCSDVQSKLKEIEENVAQEQNQSNEMLNDIQKLESRWEKLNSENNVRKTVMDEFQKCEADLQKQKAALTVEKDQLEEKLQKECTGNLSHQQKIAKYIDRLQNFSSDDENERDELEQARQLLKKLESIENKISELEISLQKRQKQKSSKEKTIEQNIEDEIDTEAEEGLLKDINMKIEQTEQALNDEQLKKSRVYDENELLMKILTQPTTILEEETRLKELHEKINQLDEKISQKSKEFLSNANVYDENATKMHTLKCNLESKTTEQKNHEEKMNRQSEKSKIGTALYESLLKRKETLTDSSKKLEQLNKVKRLSDSQKSSLETLNVKNKEISILQKKCHQLLDKHTQSGEDALEHENLSLKECEDLLVNENKEYENAQAEVERLNKLSDTMIRLFHLKEEGTRLEREVQLNCDCGTDHKCSGQCQICSKEIQADAKPCMFCAGHAGEHKCEAGHVCQNLCQICQLRGDESNRCHFPYNHQDPSHHQCERVHPCPRTCEICSEPCSRPFDFEAHQQHRCSSRVCWKPCMFGTCANRCITKDHSHDAATEQVQFVKGGEKVPMKKHLCDQKHACLGICDAPGICKFEYITQQRTWATESGEEFTYDHIEVKANRGNCEIVIDAGLYSHDATKKNHHCKAHHTCQKRCPDCDAFCRQPELHQGYHTTLHRNKDQHVFTSTNPTGDIEIQSGESNESIIRRYKVGESAKPENCAVSCKRRGRGHFHLVECPGGNDCYEKKLLHVKARHSNEVYYYGADQASLKKYDQILCSTYWSLMKWLPPVNDADRTLIDLCNFYCYEHVRKDQGKINKDSMKGFCSLGAWHTGAHAFECENEHQTKESYEGVDVCFVIDTTGSMGKYIELVKSTIKRIIEENETLLKEIKASGSIQFAIVDYRDHPPEADYVFHQCQFTNHGKALAYVNGLKADSGGDTPEAVLDGLDAASSLKWRDKADHLLFHILDAPPHGKTYYSGEDRWPRGCPCGKTANSVLTKMKEKKVSYNVLKCSSSLNMMITEFEKYIELKILVFDENINFEKIITKRVHQQLIDTEITMKKFAA